MALIQRLTGPPVGAATPTTPTTSNDVASISPTRTVPQTQTGMTQLRRHAADTHERHAWAMARTLTRTTRREN